MRKAEAFEFILPPDGIEKPDLTPKGYYTWHTQEDEKVRPSHAANNGKVFAWDIPPPTGHPGEEYGCRCWAVPYDGPIAGPLPPPSIFPVAEFFIDEFGQKEVTFLKRSNKIRIETLGLFFVVQEDQRFGYTSPLGSLVYSGFTSSTFGNLFGERIFDVQFEFSGTAPISAGTVKSEFVSLGSGGDQVTITFSGTILTPKDTRVRVFEIPD